jgi:phosphate transport system substrate-binding protein
MVKGKANQALSITLCILLGGSLLAGCGKGTEAKIAPAGDADQTAGQPLTGTVTASGSSALLPLVKQAAADFMDLHKQVAVNVTGGGSGTGIKNVADGTSDIGNSDVDYGPEYKDKGLVDHVVAIAPFAMIVNNDVAVKQLTKNQAADIFSGAITNWQDVGGKDQRIVVVTRPESSGSRMLVANLVMDGKPFVKSAITQAESGALKTAVAQTPGAIGYVDYPYVDQTVKALAFNGVDYSPEAIQAGKYPLYGVEHMYTKGEPTGVVKAFLEFMMSNDFQKKRVEQLKFLPAAFLGKR